MAIAIAAACASLHVESTRPRTNASICARSSAWPSRFLRMISCASIPVSLLPVRNPDILHVRGRAQELAPLAFEPVEPVALFPRGPGALHVRRGRSLDRLHPFAAAHVPHRFHVVVLGEHPR